MIILGNTTIVSAAIKVWSEVYHEPLILSAPPPASHDDLLHSLYEIGQIAQVPANAQGFLTSTGEFVSRVQAHEIVMAAEQPRIINPSHIEGKLFSEDLW